MSPLTHYKCMACKREFPLDQWEAHTAECKAKRQNKKK